MSATYVDQMYRYNVDSICKIHQICRYFQYWRGWRMNIYPTLNQSILPAGKSNRYYLQTSDFYPFFFYFITVRNQICSQRSFANNSVNMLKVLHIVLWTSLLKHVLQYIKVYKRVVTDIDYHSNSARNHITANKV